MIFWGFFALSAIRLIFANETKDIEISFNKTNFMQCSITCPSFPKDINLMHNPTCEFPIPTTTSSSSTTSTTTTTTTPPTTPKTPPPTTPPSTPPPTTSPSTSKTPPTTSSSTSTSTTPTTTTTTTATTPIPTTTGTSPSTTTTITPTTTTTSSTSTTNTPPTQTSSPTPPPTSTPTNVCGEIKKQVCLNGDPHYRTFDGSHFEYQGTCPHTFVERCNGIEDFDYFSVKVKNQRFGKVSFIQSAQIELNGERIFINLDTNLYVNERNQSYPYHYQDILNNNEISITKNEKKISLISTNNGKSGIQVHLNSHTLCVDIPDCPEYFGTDKLCGLAGSYNGYCGDDLVYPNKTIVKDQGYPCTYGNEVNKWANAWRTNDYFSPSYYNDTKCDPGVDSVENRTCNFAIHECEPIRSALKGVKAFSQCKDLDYSEVYSEYSKCVDHLCEKKLSKCEALENFANFCETKLKDVALNTWRKELNCPKRKIGLIMNSDDEY